MASIKIDTGPLAFLRWSERFKNWDTGQDTSITKNSNGRLVIKARQGQPLKLHIVPFGLGWIEEILLIKVEKTGPWGAAPSALTIA